MLFKPELVTKIVAGEKTQTRRLEKPGDYLDGDTVRLASGRARFQVGRVESVQPGRGKYGVCVRAEDRLWTTWDQMVADIRCWSVDDAVNRIRRKGMQTIIEEGEFVGYYPLRIETTGVLWDDNIIGITDEDALAEGITADSDDPGADFLRLWCSIRDKPSVRKLDALPKDEWRAYLRKRPARLFEGWRVSFRVVRTF